jgi:hypothetical protein
MKTELAVSTANAGGRSCVYPRRTSVTMRVRAAVVAWLLTACAIAQITISGSGTMSGTATVSTQSGQATMVYASPAGNDSNDCSVNSPCLTPQRVSAILQTKPAGSKTAIFHDGFYPATVWTLGAADSGMQANPVTYMAYPGETPVISGGRQITGTWTQGARTCGGACQEWDVTLDANPGDSGYFTKFESLFYKGERRYRPTVGVGSDGWSVQSGISCVNTSSAAAPIQGNCATGKFQAHDRYSRDAADSSLSVFHAVTGSCTTPGNCTGMHEVEIYGMENWTGALMRVTPSSNDGTNPCTTSSTTYCLTGITSAAPNFGPKTNHHYLRVNAIEDLSQPGQFYLDVCPATNCSGGSQENAFILRYLAKAAENPNTDTVIVPQSSQILTASNVQYVNFQGLTFAHDNYVMPAAGQAATSFSSNIQSTMSFSNATGVSFSGDTWSHMGRWAWEFKGASSGNSVTNFVCTDLGVGCGRIGVPPAGGDTDSTVPNNNTVNNGIITGGMRILPGGPGTAISIGNAHHNTVSHLQIDDWYNTAIEVGESMGYDTTSLAHDNTVTRNVISNIGEGVTSDLGGIHVASGAATGNVLSYNVVHDATQDTDPPGYNGECLYVDNSSSYVSVTGNLLYRCSEAGILLNSNTDNGGRGNAVTGNIIAGGKQGAIKQTTSNTYLSLTAHNNIFLMDGGNGHGGPQFAHDMVTPGVQWYCQGGSCPSYFNLDYNVYWNAGIDLSASGSVPWYTTDANGTAAWMNWGAWNALGEDTHSTIADPGFIGATFAQGDDYRFRGNPPAGFTVVDYSLSGPTGITMPAAVPPAFPLSLWPLVKSVGPSAAAVGSTVTVSGKSFQFGAVVSFGSTMAATTFVSPTELTAVVPSETGAVSVTVTNPNGKADVLLNVFTVLTSGGFTSSNAYCSAGDNCNFGGTDTTAALPISGTYTAVSGTPSPGTTVTATSCSDFSTKLAGISAGQTLVVPVTLTCTGTYTLPAVSGADINHWVTIRTDQMGNANFPVEGVRASPCQNNVAALNGRPAYPCVAPAKLMPTFNCATTNCLVFQTATGAAYYRMIGLEVTTTTKSNNYIVQFTGGDHIILDRSVIHSPDNSNFSTTLEVKGGVQVNGATHWAVIDSYLWGFMCVSGGACVDAQAIAGGNGSAPSGPGKLVNNFLEAAGESYIFGGGYGTASGVPTDFEIRRNHLYKPLTWFCGYNANSLCAAQGDPHPTIKNLGEFKNGKRILLEGNIYENNWTGYQGDQFGIATLMTAKSQSSYTSGTVNASTNTLTATAGSFPSNMTRALVAGNWYTVTNWVSSTVVNVTPDPGTATGLNASRICSPGLTPDAVVQDMTFRYNIIEHATGGMGASTALSDCLDSSQGIHSYSIHDNVMDDLNAQTYSNAANPCCTGGQGFKMINGDANPGVWPTSLAIFHNTILGNGFANATVTGMGYISGNTTSYQDYWSGYTFRDNVGLAPYGIFYNGGATFVPVVTGLNVLGCPNHDGLNCTWTFTKNLHITGAYSGQKDNTGYPVETCGSGSATCSPTSPTGIFVNYNNGNGGDYHLAAGSPYKNAGTDGKDLGADVDAVLQYTNGVQ